MTVDVLGVRHHGPGSARSVARVLEDTRPSCVLIEGPPELSEVAALAALPSMQPPVAALVYAPDTPGRARFYPLAVFSPEWIALRWALSAGAQVQFIDLPASIDIALDIALDAGLEAARDGGRSDDGQSDDGRRDDGRRGIVDDAGFRVDPIATLAAAAGIEDAEQWWDEVVEADRGRPPFEAILEAMRVLRSELGPELSRPFGPIDEGGNDDGGNDDGGNDDGGGEPMTQGDPPVSRNDLREASMRQGIRAAQKAGHERIAVVCGAWHAPVLAAPLPSAASDAALLKGLPKAKVAATWVPWTNRRLGRASGYGAGVTAPGWYHHLFTTDTRVIERWMVQTARSLRQEGVGTVLASSASVIEAVRLTTALAAVRGRTQPGLSEVIDATRSVLCAGSDVPMELIARTLLVGTAMGSVPDETPMVPLATDLARLQKSLRLKPSAATVTLDLDLRKPIDLERSYLLHRLTLLRVPWGVRTERQGRTTGTFHEVWDLTWDPELSVALIEASGSGTTVETAAAATATTTAGDTEELPVLTALVEACLLSALPSAVTEVMARLSALAAEQHDVGMLMGAVPPLARVCRYGDVRRTDVSSVRAVLDVMVVRVCIGLPGACASLDDDAALAMREHIDAVQGAVALVEEMAGEWLDAIERVAGRTGVHGLVAGRCVRILLDAGRIPVDEAGRRLGLALTLVNDPAQAAAWLDGFIAGSALLLLHDDTLLGVIDSWIAGLSEETFDDLVALLRRSFSAFTGPERRMLGDKLRTDGSSLSGSHSPLGIAVGVDAERGARAVPLLMEVLGL